MKKLTFIFLPISLVQIVWADIPEYDVLQKTKKIVIDGILDEADWAAAKPVGDFKFRWWENKLSIQPVEPLAD